MDLFKVFRIARELIALGEDATEVGIGIARLFHKEKSPQEAEKFYREMQSQKAGSKSAYETSKTVGRK